MADKKNNFDLIRFVLALIVVMAHISDLSRNKQLLFLRPFFDSTLAVTGFFILSGFLITKSYLSTRGIRNYFSKRANRLLPGYVFTVVIGAILLSMVSTLGFKDYFTHPDFRKYLFCNLAFLNFLQPCLPGVFSKNPAVCAVNGALWTIKVEVGFYILIPLIIFLLEKTKNKSIFLVCMFGGAFLYRQVIAYLYTRTGNQLFDTLEHQLPAYLSYFACGIAMHYYLGSFLKYKNKIICVAVCVYALEYYLSWDIFKPIALTAIVFYIAYNFKFLNKFGKGGDFSYGIYIYHFPLIQVCVSFGWFDRFNPFLITLSILILVLIMGITSWNLLEKKFVNRKYQRPELTKVIL